MKAIFPMKAVFPMKAKVNKFYQDRVRPTTKQVKAAGANWLLRHSIIFAKLYQNSTDKKGRFFTMKAKASRFYLTTIKPKLAALKATVTSLTQGVTRGLAARATAIKQQGQRWLSRRRSRLEVTALLIAGLAIGVILAALWQRSAAFRTAARSLSVIVLSSLMTLWALFRALGLSLGQGVTGLGQGLRGLAAGAPNLLTLLRTLLTSRRVNIVIVTNPAPADTPVPDNERLL